MKTYQDLLEIGENDKAKMEFCLKAIDDHKASELYKTAVDAELYMQQKNTTINAFIKTYNDAVGRKVIDTISANYKIASNFLKRFVIQANQYSLGNGVTFNHTETKKRLGGDDFDTVLQKAGEAALVGGVSFGFFNFDHVEVFKVTEFVPLWDEENGALSAGIRFWQIAVNKPLRFTLYDKDGVTEYKKPRDGNIEIIRPQQPYKQIVRTSEADGTKIYAGENYPSFPIVPLWGNSEHQSMLIGLKEQIDAYDLIKSGFANTIEEAASFYWVINNAGGMLDQDFAEFIKETHEKHIARTSGDGATVEARTLDVPYASREALLDRLENDMYNDVMGLNIRGIAAGNNVATAVRAAYEPMNNRADKYEYEVIQFVKGLLALVNIDDAPTFKRSQLVNQTEETAMILSAAQYLDDQTIIELLPFVPIDMRGTIMKRKDAEEVERYADTEQTEGETGEV